MTYLSGMTHGLCAVFAALRARLAILACVSLMACQLLWVIAAHADVMQWDANGNLIDINGNGPSNDKGVFQLKPKPTLTTKVDSAKEPDTKTIAPTNARSSSKVSPSSPPNKPRKRSLTVRQKLYQALTREVAFNYAATPGPRSAGLTSVQFIELFTAMIERESAFNPRAESSKGARGLGQLMPDTASDYGVTNVWDASQNLNASARFFTDQLSRFGRVDLALAAYNAGPTRVARLGRIPKIKETQDYVRWIQRTAGLSLPAQATTSQPPATKVAAAVDDTATNQVAVSADQPQSNPFNSVAARAGTTLSGEKSVWEF